MKIKAVSVDDAAVWAAISLHLSGMHANTPAGHVFAFDDSALRHPDVTLFGAYIDEELAGIGALHSLSPFHAELKSMRTLPQFLRRGVASRLLDHCLTVAKSWGVKRVSLETGSGAAFEAAIALYERRGFRSGHAFGPYTASDFNQFFHLDI